MKFRNEYKQLKQENNLIFSTLAECDRDTITDILNTISNSRGINYDVELVRKDLIAMAASAEADGQYLPAVIGDVETFKLDLLASIPHPKLIRLHAGQPGMDVHLRAGDVNDRSAAAWCLGQPF